MIIGVFWGYHHLRKHPYTISTSTAIFRIFLLRWKRSPKFGKRSWLYQSTHLHLPLQEPYLGLHRFGLRFTGTLTGPYGHSFTAGDWRLVCGVWPCSIFKVFQKSCWDIALNSTLHVSLKNLRLQHHWMSANESCYQYRWYTWICLRWWWRHTWEWLTQCSVSELLTLLIWIPVILRAEITNQRLTFVDLQNSSFDGQLYHLANA